MALTKDDGAMVEQIKQMALMAATKGVRDAHPKAHGCVKAKFIVDPSGLPNEAQVGVFKEPRTFDAWIRFSNAQPIPQNDKEDDVRGMAIKLMGVDGAKLLENERDEETQDFLLISNETFFARTPAEFLQILALVGNPDQPPKVESIPPDLLPLVGILKAAQESGIKNPLDGKYWSTVPFQLGPSHRVKYHAASTTPGLMPTDMNSPNFMQEVMKTQLEKSEARFTFFVQFHEDDATTPIEDPTKAWPTEFIPVATIVIPPQDFTSAEQKEFCENLSFTPWHSLPEHEPLGAINRARKPVYDAVSAERHRVRNVERKEPTA